MKNITFEVVGLEPGMLMNNPASIVITRQGETKAGPKYIPTPEEEAEPKTFRLPNSQLYFPVRCFQATILYAAKGVKFGKSFASSLVKTGIFVINTEMRCPLYYAGSKEPIFDYKIDTQRAVIGKSSVMRSRPLLEDWMCRVNFEYDERTIAPEQIKDLFVRAGLVSGVGDHRPSNPDGNPGPYGKFVCELLP